MVGQGRLGDIDTAGGTRQVRVVPGSANQFQADRIAQGVQDRGEVQLVAIRRRWWLHEPIVSNGSIVRDC